VRAGAENASVGLWARNQAGAAVELKPNSFHLMLENLKEPIRQRKPFKATLTFAKAGAIGWCTLFADAEVAPMGSTSKFTFALVWWPAWFRIRNMWGDVAPDTISFEQMSK
jgi:Copper chaperone PCu(A)C